MIQYKQGDLLKAFENGEVDTFIIQENCTVGMGAGISKLTSVKYPEVLKYNFEQLRIAKEAPEDVLGLLVPYMLKNKRYIYGIYSQYYPGSPQKGFDTHKQRLNWLFKGLDTFDRNNFGANLGLPLIASGLAKNHELKHDSDLDYFKKYIAPTVEEALPNVNVTVYYL